MRLKIIAVAALAAAGTLVGTASAAPRGAALKLTSVSKPSSSVVAGNDITVRARIDNEGMEPGGGKVRMFLVGGPQPDDVPRRIGLFETGGVLANGFKRFTVRLTIPADTAPASYRLRTCLKAKGVEKCKRSQRFTVVAAAVG